MTSQKNRPLIPLMRTLPEADASAVLALSHGRWRSIPKPRIEAQAGDAAIPAGDGTLDGRAQALGSARSDVRAVVADRGLVASVGFYPEGDQTDSFVRLDP